MTNLIDRRPLAWIIIIGIAIIGTFSAITIPREIQPEINIPIGVVTTILPGGSPLDTENLITEPLEKSISSLSNITKMSSISGRGISNIIIEFDANIDIDKKIDELKDRVDLAKNSLPEDSQDPIVIKPETNTLPIITFSISGKKPISSLKEVAEDLQDELEKISGVSQVNILGGQRKIVEVKVDKDKAEYYGLGLREISSAIKFANFNLPIGTISTDKLNYSVTVDNQYQSLDDIANIPLFQFPGNDHEQLLLSDISTVSIINEELATISQLSKNGQTSETTVSLQLLKKDKTNIIKTVDDAKAKVAEFNLPEGIEVVISNDNSEFIRTDLGILISNGIQTTILITIILFFALGFREGILAGLSIPLTLLASIAIIAFFGMTINGLTLFSLVIALGLMVDNAIVIMEGMHDNMKKGLQAREAAIKTIDDFKWPLVAGTLTTVFAFFPMLLVSGIVGQFLKSLPITISATLLSSLFISIYALPPITIKYLSKIKPEKKTSILEPIFLKIGNIFQKLIKAIISRRFFRFLVIFISLILFVLSMALPISGLLKAELFPKTDIQYFIINIEAPKGLVLSETANIVKDIEKELLNVNEIENFLTVVGSSQALTSTELFEVQGGGDSNIANITVNLKDKEERKKRSYEVAEEVRNIFKNYRKAKVEIRELSEGPPSEAPIVVRITGENIDTLKNIANEIKEITEKTPGTQNVNISLKPGINEFKFTLDQNKLNFYGLSGIDVAARIRSIIQGVEATEIDIDDESIKVFARYDFQKNHGSIETSIQEIEDMQITTPSGTKITFGDIADFSFEQSFASIQHEEEKRVIKVTSEVQKGQNTVEITTKLQEELKTYELPSGYELKFGGDTAEIQESFNDLYRSMIIGVILIGFTLVMTFNSLKQPFIILLTLPLALIGVFPGLYLIGLALSFPAFLGIVALSGVVVNDAIVLIDRINKSREAGMEFTDAIAESTNSRLQPIIITSLTTIIGILPLAMTNEFWAGLGFSLIFGLICSTLLTLLVIPVIYYSLEVKNANDVRGNNSTSENR